MTIFQSNADQALRHALEHHQAGRLAEAEALYRGILQREPRQAEAWHLLGVLAAQAGRGEAAVGLMRQALGYKPDYPEALTNLGKLLRELGRLEEAIAALRQAVALQGDLSEAYFQLGLALGDNRQWEEAIEAYRQAIALRPNYVEAYSNLGNALKDQGRLDEAIAIHLRAIGLRPDLAESHYNLGVALGDKRLLDDAITAFRQAIALRPDFAEAWCHLGATAREKGQFDEAVALYRKAIALKPEGQEAYNNLAMVLSDQGKHDESIATYRQILARKPDFRVAHSNLIYALHLKPGCDARAIGEELGQWNRRHAAPLKKLIVRHENVREAGRRLRVGYVSPDFVDHPVGRFLLPLLANHDKDAVEVFAYSDVVRPDGVTAKLEACADCWRKTAGLGDERLAEMVRADGIDVLVDLAMHAANNRLLMFARKPAPVQVCWLAYPSSTGLTAMDYRLSDPYLDPVGMDESVYSERTVRLPATYWCYQPVAGMPEVGALPAEARGVVTFGCLNNFYKMNEVVLRVWAEILGKVAGSQLVLHARQGSHRGWVLGLMEREGVDASRVRFVDSVPLMAYYGLYNTIDIGLDPFPHGGGTTTCDTLWMGVPVVSLAGGTAVGRGGVSILSNVGLGELVGRTEGEYVRIAVELAGDWGRLGAMRSGLRQRMAASPLMDAMGFARDMEGAYRGMWRGWCRGEGRIQKA